MASLPRHCPLLRERRKVHFQATSDGNSQDMEEILVTLETLATGLLTAIHQKAITKAVTGGHTIMAKTATAARVHQKVAEEKVAIAEMTEAIRRLEVITAVTVTTGTPDVEQFLNQIADAVEPPITLGSTIEM